MFHKKQQISGIFEEEKLFIKKLIELYLFMFNTVWKIFVSVLAHSWVEWIKN